VDDEPVDSIDGLLELVGLRVLLGVLETLRTERTQEEGKEEV